MPPAVAHVRSSTTYKFIVLNLSWPDLQAHCVRAKKLTRVNCESMKFANEILNQSHFEIYELKMPFLVTWVTNEPVKFVKRLESFNTKSWNRHSSIAHFWNCLPKINYKVEIRRKMIQKCLFLFPANVQISPKFVALLKSQVPQKQDQRKDCYTRAPKDSEIGRECLAQWGGPGREGGNAAKVTFCDGPNDSYFLSPRDMISPGTHTRPSLCDSCARNRITVAERETARQVTLIKGCPRSLKADNTGLIIQ